jgi:hypothetical protein
MLEQSIVGSDDKQEAPADIGLENQDASRHEGINEMSDAATGHCSRSYPHDPNVISILRPRLPDPWTGKIAFAEGLC